MFRILWSGILVAVATTASLRAQSLTGSIEGRLLAAGAPVAGAVVSASGPALQGTRVVTSDRQGVFRVPALPVGTYTVRIAHVGHRPVAIQAVVVHLGRTTFVGAISLQATTTLLPEMVVTAPRPLIDPSDATPGTVIPSDVFTTLPTGRNFRDIVTLAPLANASALPGDEANIAGGSGPENAWFIDGVNMTDVRLGATSADLPYNFVREVEVREGGYEAEFGRSMGAAVNVVTQSGTNAWHGQVFGFFTNQALTALPRSTGTSVVRNAFREYDVGAGVGGPLARDRLFVYLAYDPTVHHEEATVSGIAAPPAAETSHLLAGKLTWRATAATDVQLTVLGDPSFGHNVDQARSWDSVANLDAALAETHRGGAAVSLTGRHEFSRRVHLEATVARLTRREEVLPATPRGGAEPLYLDLTASLLEGGYGGITRDDARRTSGRVVVTVSAEAHTVRAGLEYEDNQLETDHAQDLIVRHDVGLWEWWRYRAASTLHNRVPTAYLQDRWRVSPRLAVNVGVRWEGEILSGADTIPTLHIMDEWQPRLGFVLQIGRLGTQRVFGSYGRFYEQLPLNLSSLYQNPSWYSKVYYPQDPRVDTTGGEPQVAYLTPVTPSRDLKGQSFDQISLGYERLLGRDVRVGLRGTVRRLVWALDDAVNLDSAYQMIGNPGRGNLSFTPRATRRYAAFTIIVEKARSDRAYWQLSYTLSRASGNYEGLYDYWAAWPNPNASSAFDVANQYANDAGLLPTDRTHALELTGSYRFPFGVRTGVVASVTSGVPRNELGATPFGLYYVFLKPRGSNGRTPTLTDLNLRLAWSVPVPRGSGLRPTLLLDVFHLGNTRTPVAMDDMHYFGVDANGNQAYPNPRYAEGTFFQLPRSARLGLSVDF